MHFFTRLSQRSLNHGTAIAHIRLWHFIASVEQALQPSLRSTPFAVVDTYQTSGRVIDANELARALGVRPGTPVRRLRQRFPNVQVRLYNPERAQGFLKAFFTQAKRWGIIATTDAVNHAVTVTIPAVNALERAAVFLHVQEACWHELECNVIVGVGPTAAFAKLAAAACVEPGFRYLDRHEQQALNALPIRSIPGIGRRTAFALVQLSVSTVWHFLQLDAGTVEQLGGRSLLRLYRQYLPVVPLPLMAPLAFQPVQVPRLFQRAAASGAA